MIRSLLAATLVSAVLCFQSVPTQAATATQDAQPAPTPAASDKIPYSQLTPDEREILDRGEISDTTYAIGGLVGTFVGFGLGEAVQGRYLPTGLIITLGEAVSMGLLVDSLVSCTATALTNGLSASLGGPTQNCSLGTAGTIGVVGLVTFHIWEIVDVWAVPPSINARYRRLKEHVEGAPEPARSSLGIVPAFAAGEAGSVGNLDGAALAYQIRF